MKTRRHLGVTQANARVRLGIYRFILRTERVPAAAELAISFRKSESEVLAAYRRLAAAHAIVLEANGERILRAAPFWGSPTAFAVEVGRRSHWASCIWDALGVPGMLRRDSIIRTACGCCSEAMEVQVRGGRLRGARGVIHFAVPARRWYDDIAFT